MEKTEQKFKEIEAQIADLSGRMDNVVALVIRLVKQLGHEYRGIRQEVQDTKKTLAEIQEELEHLQQSQQNHGDELHQDK
jgi:predicted  nucleic acid-binding Zn-ribbon protein